MAITSSGNPPPESKIAGATKLRANTVTTPGVLMQSVTSISPAIAGLFTVPFIVANAGVTAPLAYAGAFVIALLLGYVLSQFARHISSAGSYYTFVRGHSAAEPDSSSRGCTCSSTRS